MSKRLLITVIFILASVLLLPSCSGVEYKDDVKVSDLESTVVGKLADGGNFSKSATYIEDNFNDPSVISGGCSEYVFYNHSSATVIDQFAIFRVKDSASVKDVKAEVETFMNAHVAELKSIVEKYDASEADKLDRANVHVAGNYILYTLLGQDDSINVLGEFNRALQK